MAAHLQDDDPVLVQVRTLCHRLENANWMPKPREWVWVRPDGRMQGFGVLWPDQPGLANLLWLAMDMGSPPQRYDSASNTLFSLVLLHAEMAKLDGGLLHDWAGVLTLRQFHDRLPEKAGPGPNPIERTYPLLKLLAARRLLCQP